MQEDNKPIRVNKNRIERRKEMKKQERQQQTSFSNVVIGSTTDYGMFKIVDSNRKLKKSNVENLIKSFKITNGMKKSKPIIVDKSLNVIDGQHRLEACKKMGIPVHYIITEDVIEDIPLYNTYQIKWGLDDYARYFAQRGNKNYEKILEIQGRVGIGTTAILECLGMITGRSLNINFKEGRFVFDGDVDKSVETIEKILKLCYLIKRHRSVSNRIIRAVRFLNKIKSFNLDELISKIEKFPSKRHSCGTREEYIDMFIEIYNYHRQANDSITSMDVLIAQTKEKEDK